MQIEHITTHLLDPSAKTFLPGTAETDLSASYAYEFVSAKLDKLFSANQRHAGAFSETAWLPQKIRLYQDQQMAFGELSAQIADRLYETKISCGILEPTSLIIAQLVREERRYLCVLDQGYRKAVSCYLKTENENEFLQQQVLSSSLLKEDFAFTVELSDLSLHIIEEQRTLHGERMYVLSKHFLDASAKASYRESSKEIERVTKALSEKYEMDPNMFAVLAYDATNMMAQAISDAGSTDSQAIIDAMAALEYDGLTGRMTFDEDRNPQKSAVIVSIQDNAYKFVENYDPEA